MNLYEQFLNKQKEIIEIINQKTNLENELTKIKGEIYKIHKERFKQKPVGKTVLTDQGFEISYDRKEKVTVLTEAMKKDGFDHKAIIEKTKTTTNVTLDKKEYKKLSDKEREVVDKYLAKEPQKPTMTVTLIED